MPGGAGGPGQGRRTGPGEQEDWARGSRDWARGSRDLARESRGPVRRSRD